MDKKGLKRKHAAPFKSPFAKEATSRVVKTDQQAKADLQAQLAEINKQIEDLETQGLKEEELKTHIDKLHEYNEIKDVGQMVLGRLANHRQATTKDLYEQYGLDVDD